MLLRVRIAARCVTATLLQTDAVGISITYRWYHSCVVESCNETLETACIPPAGDRRRRFYHCAVRSELPVRNERTACDPASGRQRPDCRLAGLCQLQHLPSELRSDSAVSAHHRSRFYRPPDEGLCRPTRSWQWQRNCPRCGRRPKRQHLDRRPDGL